MSVLPLLSIVAAAVAMAGTVFVVISADIAFAGIICVVIVVVAVFVTIATSGGSYQHHLALITIIPSSAGRSH